MEIETAAAFEETFDLSGQLLLANDPCSVGGRQELAHTSSAQLRRTVAQHDLADAVKFEEAFAPLGGHGVMLAASEESRVLAEIGRGLPRGFVESWESSRACHWFYCGAPLTWFRQLRERRACSQL